MNFGEPEPFHVRRQHFFHDYKFKFEGLDPEIQKEFEDCVQVQSIVYSVEKFLSLVCLNSFFDKKISDYKYVYI